MPFVDAENALPVSPMVVRVPDWAGLDWLLHGFSTRIGGETTIYLSPASSEVVRQGELNMGSNTADSAKNVLVNRQRFVAAIISEIPPPPLVTLRQIHSTLIHRIGLEQAADGAVLEGDGLMTDEPGVLLGIQTADCLPVLIADRKHHAVAAFHAGWRGTLGRIVAAGVGRMRAEFASEPEDLVAAIGPGIGQCCYSVGEAILQDFRGQFSYAEDRFRAAACTGSPGTTFHLDLVEANRRQLLDAGLKAEAIAVIGECTSCHPERYFSHRKQKGFTGRMLSVVGVRKYA